MQNQSSKVKTELKNRAYQYSIKIIDFIDILPKDISFHTILKQLVRSATSIGANILGSSILTLEGKKWILNFKLWFLAFSFELLTY